MDGEEHEEQQSYRRNVTYDVSLDQIRALIDVSQNCRQFIKVSTNDDEITFCELFIKKGMERKEPSKNQVFVRSVSLIIPFFSIRPKP